MERIVTDKEAERMGKTMAIIVVIAADAVAAVVFLILGAYELWTMYVGD